ncbi:hypothetical protein E2C01_052464 [Portunus trituberculatus]|uniref:Uncharacterized protein n=1 Tax=Portunus trituberculatus TaxID=210409 RepID=A0A5B7GLM7_PORTR|nr:hypothetical protein [Portunus trituberculatus]
MTLLTIAANIMQRRGMDTKKAQQGARDSESRSTSRAAPGLAEDKEDNSQERTACAWEQT